MWYYLGTIAFLTCSRFLIPKHVLQRVYEIPRYFYHTVRDRLFRMRKTFYQQVLKLCANEASAKGLQNALYNECHTKLLTKLWAFENRPFVWRLYKIQISENPIQIIYWYLPIWPGIPTGGRGDCFKDTTPKSVRLGPHGIGIKMVSTESIFEKMSSSWRKRRDADRNLAYSE